MFIGPVVGGALCTAFSWRAGVTPLRRVTSCSPECWRRLCSRQIAASLATAVMVFLIGCFPLSGEFMGFHAALGFSALLALGCLLVVLAKIPRSDRGANS